MLGSGVPVLFVCVLFLGGGGGRALKWHAGFISFCFSSGGGLFPLMVEGCLDLPSFFGWGVALIHQGLVCLSFLGVALIHHLEWFGDVTPHVAVVGCPAVMEGVRPFVMFHD